MRVPRIIYEACLNTELEPALKYYAMRILKEIYVTSIWNIKEGGNGYIEKHREYIRNVCGRNGANAKKIFDTFADLDILKINHAYQAGAKCKSYYVDLKGDGTWVTVRALDFLNTRQLADYRKREEKIIDEKLKWHYNNLLKMTEPNYKSLQNLIAKELDQTVLYLNPTKEELLDFLMNLNFDPVQYKNKPRKRRKEYKKAHLRIKCLEILELENTTIKQGRRGRRHYHALSNASKELRTCIQSKNPKKPILAQMDIRNCQPLLLLGIMLKRKMEIEEGIQKATMAGLFYETVAHIWGFNSEDVKDEKRGMRGRIKKLVYSKLFFAREFDNEYFHKLQEHFPKYCQNILALAEEQKGDGKELASLLQSTESSIMLPIVKRHKGFGIHDSCVVAVADASDLVNIVHDIIKAFLKIKLKLTPENVGIEVLSWHGITATKFETVKVHYKTILETSKKMTS